MPEVYFVAVANVADRAQLDDYEAKAVPTLGSAGVLAVDASVRTVEGDPRNRVVILKFESEEACTEWYKSEAYQKVLPLRLNSISDGWAGMATAFG